MNFNSPRVVAIRVSQSFQDLGKFLRKVNYFKSKKITISRKGLLNVEMQKMDMLKFRKNSKNQKLS